ncbi:hypothetical protein C0992_001019 [Termitomyces sp. T32_za158]|nr:hypothetical protein C0992_001019 [Termitomyces sp. T32_za158]
MCNELRSLVDEIHMLPNHRTFKNPMDPARSFHVQRETPLYLGDAARTQGQHNQEEQNAASATLHALNPNRGLFEQPAARTIGLSARQRANSVPSAVRTWGQAICKNPGAAPPPRPPRDEDARSNDTLCYVDPPAPLQLEPASFHCERPPHFDLCQTWGRDAPPHQNLASSTGDPREHPWAPHPPLWCPTKHLQPDRLWDHQDPRPTALTRDLPNPHRGRPAPHWNDSQHPHPTPAIQKDHPRLLGGTPAHPLAVQGPLAVQDPLARTSRRLGPRYGRLPSPPRG